MFSLSIGLICGYLSLIICSVIITSGIRLQAVVNLTNGGPQADFTGKSISPLNFLQSMTGTNQVIALIAGCWIWTTVESSTAIICACLPTMRPLAVMLFGDAMKAEPEQSDLSTIKTIGGGTTRGTYSKRPEGPNLGRFRKLADRRPGEQDSTRLWPEHYLNERETTVEGNKTPGETDRDIPMDDILVRRDMSWTDV